ncbi:MAG: hypothetical protein B7Z82_07600 [Halothiobacillus sp. 20-54-6]|nr:MAG: hypothetical protein B7Z82_07600 [Halothiobacillus sp. 20-54-6]
MPVGVGFGIRNAPTAAAVGQVADAVIIGSALVRIIAELGQGDPATLQQKVQAFMTEIRSALDRS